MKVTINGEAKSFKEKNLTIGQLLTLENVKSPEMVSVQLNGKIIERSKFVKTTLSSSDDLNFLYFMGGGN